EASHARLDGAIRLVRVSRRGDGGQRPAQGGGAGAGGGTAVGEHVELAVEGAGGVAGRAHAEGPVADCPRGGAEAPVAALGVLALVLDHRRPLLGAQAVEEALRDEGARAGAEREQLLER